MTDAGKLTYVIRMLLEIERLTDSGEIRELAGNAVHQARELLIDWAKPAGEVAGLAGLEPATSCLEGTCSDPAELQAPHSNSTKCRNCGGEIYDKLANSEAKVVLAPRFWVHANGMSICDGESPITTIAEPDRRTEDVGAPVLERRNRVDRAIDLSNDAVNRVMGRP